MAGPRTRRRPLVLVAAAVVVTAVLLIAQGAASSRPNANEAVQAYLDQVRPGVQQSVEQGADFEDVRTQARTLGRDGIDRRLDRLTHDVQSTLTSIDTLTPPARLRVAQAYLVAALGVRAKAVVEARTAFDGALTVQSTSDQGVGQAVSSLEAVGQDLDLGDRAFDLFVGSLPRTAQMPTGSPWVPDASQWTGVQITAFVDLLRSSAAAHPVHDLSMLAYQTDPAVVSIGPDGTQTIPASSTTSVSMVIENVGNQPEHNVTVLVVLSLPGGGQETLRDFIDLAPGQTRALTLRPLPTTPGMQGKLVVQVVPVPGEHDTANSSITTPVAFR
jgi:hypothetical protein